jgi:hypothetical protein
MQVCQREKAPKICRPRSGKKRTVSLSFDGFVTSAGQPAQFDNSKNKKPPNSSGGLF